MMVGFHMFPTFTIICRYGSMLGMKSFSSVFLKPT